jgi:DNA-binding transcriptional LysR family regulator
MDLEIRHLQALIAVADAGTFGKAAEALGYTQSAVSQQIAALERATGTPVFDRPGGPRPVRLTAAGEVLLEHAQTVLATLRIAEADIGAIARGDRGELRVGLMQSVGTQILPRLLNHLAVARPDVQIVLHEAQNPSDLLAMVESQDLDVAFSAELHPDGPFVTRHVLDDPFVLLVPNTPEWRDRRHISTAEAATLPLVGYRNAACAAEAELAFAGLDPTFVFRSDDNTTVQGCVAAGVGVCLAPMLAIDLDNPATRTVDLDPPLPPRTITVSWHSERRPSALIDVFVEATAEICAQVAEGLAAERAA